VPSLSLIIGLLGAFRHAATPIHLDLKLNLKQCCHCNFMWLLTPPLNTMRLFRCLALDFGENHSHPSLLRYNRLKWLPTFFIAYYGYFLEGCQPIITVRIFRLMLSIQYSNQIRATPRQHRSTCRSSARQCRRRVAKSEQF